MAVRAQIILNVNAAIVDGSFQMTLAGTVQTFTVVESFPISAAGQYNSIATLVSALQSKGFGHYSVTADGNDITVLAANYGDFYDLSAPFGSGAYGVTDYELTDGNGTPFEVDVAQTNVTIRNTADGTITLTPTGGNGGYTFAWADGPTTQNRTGLPAGEYTVIITEAGGLSQQATITITQPDYSPIDITGSVIIAACFGASTGSINISATGGNNTFTYAWSDGPTTQNRVNVPAGNYSVTVTDSVGNSDSKSFTVGQNTEIVVVATLDENDVTLAISGGVGPYTYLWSDGVTTRDRVDLEAGQYSCTITDSLGCTKSVTVNIRAFAFAFTKNPVVLPLQASSPESKPNLSFLCEIWIENVYLSNVFEKVSVQEQPADLDGSTVFDVQSILDAYLSAFLPEGKETVVSRCDGLFKRFYLRYTEKYGTPPVPAAYTQVDISYCIMGGLSFEEYAAGTFFNSYLATTKPFFTWSPVEKEVYPEQPEYLYYLHNSFDITVFKTNLKIYYSDGSLATHQAFYNTDVLRFELYSIPTGYTQLNIGAYAPAKTVISWEITVTDALGNLLSEIRKYLVRSDYSATKRYFLYLNSLGGFNTLCCTGSAVKELDPESQQVEKILPYNYRISDGETTTVKKMATPSLKVNTGYISKEQMEALQDFAISENVIFYDNDRYVPGIVTSKTIKPIDEEETLCLLEFEFMLPKMYRYTPRLS